ncbi:Ionotropic receptor 40a, partial [Diabrotica virgifera virgifera]
MHVNILKLFAVFFILKDVNSRKFMVPDAYTIKEIKNNYGGDLITALYEFISGFPLQHITIGFDYSINERFIEHLLRVLHDGKIVAMTFNFSNPDIVEKYFSYLSHQTENFYESSTLFLGRHRIYEYLLIE